MKKISLTLIITLVITAAITGCSEQYCLERMVWQAERLAEPIFINKGMVSSYEFDRAISLYEKIIKKAPDSRYTLNAQNRIAELYALQKSFDKARQMYDVIIRLNEGRQEVVAQTLFSKAQTYENEDNWPEALKIFNEVIKKYPKTQQSLFVPLYIAQYYVKKDNKSAAAQEYQKARDYYQAIAREYPNTKGALLCENLILRTYVEEGNWNNAVDYLKSFDAKYKLGPGTLMILAKIYHDKLNEPAKAIETYKRFLRDFPQDKLAESVKKEIKKLEKPGNVK